MRDAEETMLLKPRQAAKLMNISTSKMYDALARGDVPAVRVAGCLRVPRVWLDQQIDGAIAGTVTRDSDVRGGDGDERAAS